MLTDYFSTVTNIYIYIENLQYCTSNEIHEMSSNKTRIFTRSGSTNVKSLK